MHFKTLLCLLTTLLFLPLAASAHRLNESYVYFDVTDTTLGGRFEANVVDLVRILPLDDNRDGEVTEDELQANAQAIFEVFQNRLVLTDGGTVEPISFTGLTTLGTAEGVFVQLGFEVPGITQTPNTIEVDYEPLSDVLETPHAGYILIGSNSRLGLEENEFYISLFFSPADGPQTLSLSGEPLGKLFLDFVEHGLWHVWLGFDHLVFLATLLLAAVLLAREGRWHPQEPFQTALWGVIGLVTVFTIAQAITLTLAALNIATAPLVVVDGLIGLCVITIAVMNILPALRRHILWVVLFLGLVHGLGFAPELTPLGQAPSQLSVGLVAFTLGVELGQLAIVVLVFPILWALRKWSLYVPLAVRFGSVAMIALMGVWILEQTTGFNWNVRATLAFFTGGGT